MLLCNRGGESVVEKTSRLTSAKCHRAQTYVSCSEHGVPEVHHENELETVDVILPTMNRDVGCPPCSTDPSFDPSHIAKYILYLYLYLLGPRPHFIV
jgi:hypothetical protein